MTPQLTTSSSTKTLLSLTTLVVVLSALACAAPQPQQGSTSEAQGSAAPQAKAQPAPAQAKLAADASDLPKPTAESVALAKQYGIAAVDPASGVAGPYPGPEGSIYYLSAEGLATFYLPAANAAYLAKLKPQLTWHYGFNASGYYQFTPQGAQPLQNLNVMSPWPHAVPVANALVARIKQQQQAAAAATPAQKQQQQQMDWATYQRLSQLSAAQHRSMMGVINNLGDSGCTKRYEGVYYVGCW